MDKSQRFLGWKQGTEEEILVGLKNNSSSSVIIFGIIANFTDPKKPSVIIRKSKTKACSADVAPGHLVTLSYKVSVDFDEPQAGLEVLVHYMDKVSIICHNNV